ARQNSFERPPLRIGRALVENDGLQPAAFDHALRCIERDDRACTREGHVAEFAVIDPERPVALAALVRAVLAEMHMTRTDERARTVLEDQPASKPSWKRCHGRNQG